MSVVYRHTQRGTAILYGLALAASFDVLAAYLVWTQAPAAAAWPAIAVLAAILVLLAAVAWYFSSMTVEVTDDELRWHFGPGRDFKIVRAEIEGVGAVRHPLLWGYGIRWVGARRWVYIVTGREAVEVRLKDGGWVRLGTDDPQGLIAALTSAQS